MLKPFHLRQSAAHKRLVELASTAGALHLRDLFAQDSSRLQRMSSSLDGLYIDWSKHRVTDEVMEALFALADEAGWAEGVQQLFAGQHINQTEGRAVLHMALRGEAGDGFTVDGEDVMNEVLATREAMGAFADALRSNGRIKDVVNIGIGGSDLGPLMVTKALRNLSKGGPKVHFVSNVDGAHLESVLDGLIPESTLFIVVSKTFTTQETMANADAAKAWIQSASLPVAEHFAAVSTNVPAAVGFGVDKANVFGFRDWVGGRYSLWGPVGMSIACSVGSAAFGELLAGARAMDRHVAEALLGEMYRSSVRFWEFGTANTWGSQPTWSYLTPRIWIASPHICSRPIWKATENTLGETACPYNTRRAPWCGERLEPTANTLFISYCTKARTFTRRTSSLWMHRFPVIPITIPSCWPMPLLRRRH